MFHSVGVEPVSLCTGEAGPQANPELFEAFTGFLARHAKVVTVSELARVTASNRHLRERFAAITLDDGYEDNSSVALPILVRHQVPATVFLTSRMVRLQSTDPGQGLSQRQIQDMLSAGIEFGAHSVTHPYLTQIPFRQAEREIAESKEFVEGLTACRCEGFCYPYGAFDDQIKQLVKSRGFTYAVTTQDRLFGDVDRFSLPRTVLAEDAGEMEFAVRLSGAHAWRQSFYPAARRLRGATARA
jgi:peptidoglycan/xylan/chitin deacetylase (PgdA/CDA1 family)